MQASPAQGSPVTRYEAAPTMPSTDLAAEARPRPSPDGRGPGDGIEPVTVAAFWEAHFGAETSASFDRVRSALAADLGDI
eukprot:290488-Prymnesium_polylepis.1